VWGWVKRFMGRQNKGVAPSVGQSGRTGGLSVTRCGAEGGFAAARRAVKVFTVKNIALR